MAANLGRKVTLTRDGSAIEGVREKSVTLNGEPIDITDGASDGWRELLAEAGENSVEIAISGVTKDDVLRAEWFSGDRTKPTVMTWPTSGGTITGDFFLATYSEAQPYKEAITFEGTLQSTGEVTYTPAA